MSVIDSLTNICLLSRWAVAVTPFFAHGALQCILSQFYFDTADNAIVVALRFLGCGTFFVLFVATHFRNKSQLNSKKTNKINREMFGAGQQYPGSSGIRGSQGVGDDIVIIIIQ